MPMYYFTTVTLTSSADSVCPGDTVVFTCVTDTAPLVWSTSVNEHVKVYYSSDQVNQPAVNVGDIFTIKLVNITGQFLSTATVHSVSSDYNGVNITCSNNVKMHHVPRQDLSLLVRNQLLCVYRSSL